MQIHATMQGISPEVERFLFKLFFICKKSESSLWLFSEFQVVVFFWSHYKKKIPEVYLMI